MKNLLIGLVVIIIAILTYLRYGKQPEPIDHNTFSYQMLQPGPYSADAIDVQLVDQTRPTAGSGEYPGSETRTLLTRIWQPDNKRGSSPAPLVLYSHGFMSNRIGGRYLARHLASHGYIVVAPDFPLTSFDASGPKQLKDVVNQPADLSFIIDSLLERNRTAGDSLYQAIDEKRIAAIGTSLGGLTSTLTGFHPTMGDDRIAAVISIAGPSFLFTDVFFSHRSIPFMMIASPSDVLVDYSRDARPILEKINDATLVSIDGASHTGFTYQAVNLRWLKNPDTFGCWAIRRSAGAEFKERWYKTIGTNEQGVVPIEYSSSCDAKPFDRAMNPIEQHWLTTLAVTSFLESQFAVKPDERERHRQFLHQQFAHEIDAVTIETTEQSVTNR